MFPPDDPWFGSDTYKDCAVLYDLYLDVYMMGYVIYIYIYICLTDGERHDLRWPALSGHWLSCTECWLYLLRMKLLMYGTLFLHISTSLGCFCPQTIFTKKIRIGQATSDLLCLRFTYTKHNQQGCSRLSNWFSLWCLGRWINHFPPVWWSTFRSRFELSVGVKVCYGGEGFFSWFLAFIHFHTLP